MDAVKSIGNVARSIGSTVTKQVKIKVKKGVEVANYIATNTDALHKTIKVATATFALLTAVLGTFVPGSEGAITLITNIGKAPKAAQGVIGATNVAGRYFEWTDQVARAGITKTPQKALSRAFLTVGQTLETIAFVGNVASVNLGFLAANVIGNLPVINLVKGTFIVGSSAFGIWDASNVLRAAKTAQVKAEQKLVAWKNITESEVVAKYNAKSIEADVVDGKRANYCAYIQSKDISDRLTTHKIEKYEKIQKNTTKVVKKSWLAIAADIAKIAIIVVGTIAAAFLLSATAFLFFTATLGVIVTSIGLAKTLYGEFGPKPEPLPQFQINAA